MIKDTKLCEKIYELYFQKMLSISAIMDYFNKQYTYAEIKSTIHAEIKRRGK